MNRSLFPTFTALYHIFLLLCKPILYAHPCFIKLVFILQLRSQLPKSPQNRDIRENEGIFFSNNAEYRSESLENQLFQLKKRFHCLNCDFYNSKSPQNLNIRENEGIWIGNSVKLIFLGSGDFL